jgi:hypothetical protein
MKTITSILVLMSISLGLFSQEFNIPKDYQLVNVEDYAPYEQDVVNCIDWLVKTPLNEQSDKRNEANTFLLKWLSGSPNVHIESKQEIVSFMSSSPDLLMIIMGGWAKYSLESKDFDNKVNGSIAGIEAVIEFYKANREFLSKDKNVEKYIKMKNKGKLEEYIEKNA